MGKYHLPWSSWMKCEVYLGVNARNSPVSFYLEFSHHLSEFFFLKVILSLFCGARLLITTKNAVIVEILSSLILSCGTLINQKF